MRQTGVGMGMRGMRMSSSDEFKVGDQIAVDNRFGGIAVYTIKKVTQNMYVCDGIRFRKDLGIVGADTWGPFRGSAVTPELKIKMRIQRASNGLKHLKVTPHNIDAVEALLKEPT